jgi:non-ribosomal peptide synthetase component E (peptide arylation enzyme)
VGRADPRLGERAAGVVVPRPSPRRTLADLQAFLLQRGLSKKLLPEELLFAATMPAHRVRGVQSGDVREWVSRTFAAAAAT